MPPAHKPPEPRYSCTIPSIHDDTPLNCRIYHPDVLPTPQTGEDPQWRKRGIVMAHPYAPMGGSCDDRVVGIVVDEFLRRGWIVATFNFRGAHGSKGRTSWSGRPELDDFISFAAFFMHYLSFLRPSPAPDVVFSPDSSPTSPQKQNQSDAFPPQDEEVPIVILGGYSYGSLVLKHLPPVPSILQPFSVPPSGSAAEEIIRYAHKIADQSNLEWINQTRENERSKRKGNENKLSVTMGGEETSPEKRRSSREIRRSMDGRRSLDLSGTLRSLSHRRKKDEHPITPPETPSASPTIPMPSIRYLLISPLMPPISTLAAPALGHKFWNKSHAGCGEVIGKHQSLAIYGDGDIFTSVKKVRDWAERLRSESVGRFESVEVAAAGHFWHERGVEEALREALRGWEGRMV